MTFRPIFIGVTCAAILALAPVAAPAQDAPPADPTAPSISGWQLEEIDGQCAIGKAIGSTIYAITSDGKDTTLLVVNEGWTDIVDGAAYVATLHIDDATQSGFQTKGVVKDWAYGYHLRFGINAMVDHPYNIPIVYEVNGRDIATFNPAADHDAFQWLSDCSKRIGTSPQ